MKALLNLMSDRLHALPLVVLYLTDGCNSRCVTCDIWRNPRRNMSKDLVESIAADNQKLGIRWLLLSGGEAMQHPQWAEIAHRFRREGVYVMLLTNGLLVKKQAQQVIDSVDELIVSLDGGTPETYEAIRGVDGFDLIMQGIRDVRAGGIPVATRTTLQHANYAEMPQIIEAALNADVNRISFLTVDVSSQFAFGNRFAVDAAIPLVANGGIGSMPDHGPAATALTHDDLTRFEAILDEVETRFADAFAAGRMGESPEKLRGMLHYFRALAGETNFIPPRCNAPHISTVIEVDGRLRPCYFLPTYGKLNGQPLAEAINAEEALALRKAYRTGQRRECEACVCSLYKGARGLWKM